MIDLLLQIYQKSINGKNALRIRAETKKVTCFFNKYQADIYLFKVSNGHVKITFYFDKKFHINCKVASRNLGFSD